MNDAIVTYLVGGAVRDHILGVDSRDRDYVVVGSTPERMISDGFSQVGISFPVFLHPETKDEYALARTERKNGVGYSGFETFFDPTVTIEDDLARRDLTINAMAMTEDGTIIDPYNGQADIKDGILRHTSDAFADDPLRVLRLARFAARYNFSVAFSTLELAQKIVNDGELETLPRERIWLELEKGFSETNPFLMLLVFHNTGALKTSPLKDYFKGSNIWKFAAMMHVADAIHANVNRKAANMIMAMPILGDLSDKELLDMRVPNGIQDVAHLTKKLSALLMNKLTPSSVHEFLMSNRFIHNPLADLAKFIVEVEAKTMNLVEHWAKNDAIMSKAMTELKKLDMAAIAANGDKANIKFRIHDATLEAVTKVF